MDALVKCRGGGWPLPDGGERKKECTYASWGGTIVETWISKEAMKSFNEFSDVVDAMPVSMDALGEKRKTRLTNASCVVCEPLSPIS